jgi:hypothetical protein
LKRKNSDGRAAAEVWHEFAALKLKGFLVIFRNSEEAASRGSAFLCRMPFDAVCGGLMAQNRTLRLL